MNFQDFLNVKNVNETLWNKGFFWADFTSGTAALGKPLSDLGFTKEDMLSGKYQEAIHPDDYPTYKILIDRFHKGTDDQLHCEYRLLSPVQNSWQWILTQAFVIERHAGKKAKKIFGFDRIISPQKEAEKYLQDNLQSSRSILNTLETIWSIERDNSDLDTFLEKLTQIISYNYSEVYCRNNNTFKKTAERPSGGSAPLESIEDIIIQLENSQYPIIIEEIYGTKEYKSLLAIPLRQSSELTGFILLWHRKSSYYRGIDLYPIQLVSSVFVNILCSLYQEQEKEHKNRIRQEVQDELARELHDGIAQNLAYCKIVSEKMIAETDVNSSEREYALKLQKVLTRTMQEVRLLTNKIRIVTEYTHPGELLRKYAKQLGIHYGVTVQFSEINTKNIQTEPTFNENILRIMQEGISNAVRHSGEKKIEVSLYFEKDLTLHLAVSDSGHGLGIHKEGMGMSGIRERVELLGGTLSWSANTEKKGTVMKIGIPIRKTNYKEIRD